MPHTMLTDQHWQKLKAILRKLSIHLNSNLRNFIEAIFYRIRTRGHPPLVLDYSTRFSNVLIVGMVLVSYSISFINQKMLIILLIFHPV